MPPPFEMPKPDWPRNENLNHFQSFSFSADSIDTAGFNCSKMGPEKSNLSSRSRPRLTKMRRKQMGASLNGKSVNTELELNGFGGVGAEVKLDGEVGNVFKANYGKSGLKETSKNEDSTESGQRFESFSSGGLGSTFRDNMSDSVFNLGLGNGNSVFGSRVNSSIPNLHNKDGSFLFASSKGISNSDMERENGTFVFGASEAASDAKTNQKSQDGGYVFGPDKSALENASNLESSQFVFGVHETNSVLNSKFTAEESSEDLGQPKVYEFPRFGNFEFVFGFDKYESNSNVLPEQKDSNEPSLRSGSDEFGKVNSASFEFRASRNAPVANNLDSQKQHCGKTGDKDDSSKDVANAVPDRRDNVTLDSSGNSEKVSYPCFKSPSNLSGNSRENYADFVFGSANCNSKSHIDNTTSRSGDKPDFTNCSKENTGSESKFENACPNGVFVFRGLKGTGVNSVLADESNQLNREKANDYNGLRDHNHDTGSDSAAKIGNSCNSGGVSEKDFVFNLSEGMKRLNVDGSETDGKETQNRPSNLSSSVNEAFIFASTQKNACSMNENHPINASKKTPDTNPLSENSTESNGTSTRLFSSSGIGIQLNGGYCEVPSVENDNTGGISLTNKLSGLSFSDVDHTTPSLKFSFSPFMYACVDGKLDTANSKWLRGKRSKKTNRKLRTKNLVQQLFGQDYPPKAGNSQQNTRSPGDGSPMDFSPYQDTSASSGRPAGVDTAAKGEEFSGNEKDTLECYGIFRDDESNSNLSSSLPAQDGLSSIRRQYKKKYKLKVGASHAVQSNNSNKENATQVPTGAAVHEVCEHWRIRGNQAYHAGKISKAEEFYSVGINSVPDASTLGNFIKPLLLCYSNRAATRMSLGRMREAIGDCRKAAALDPNFLKVKLRAGNCYLVLGEVQKAIQCYNECLGSGTGVCLDRRASIEAADGLQKAKRVAEYMSQSAELLHEGTENAVSSALENIVGGLSISRYSERLLEMKGEALCTLRRYDEVIQLCEQTLHTAKKNFAGDDFDDPNCRSSPVRLWRWHLQIKANYHLGRLDLALDMIEQDKTTSSTKSGDATQESSIALAATIRELLRLKKLGNEAFHSGKYTEAIDHYTAAISRSIESRPFMAVCFCNRAAAYQSLSQVLDAIADCSLAVALDENYQKAISRRATLHEMIRDYKQAVYDVQRLISLLETQTQAKSQKGDTQRGTSAGSVRDLRKARRHLSLIEDKAKKDTPLDFYLILGIKTSDTEAEIKKAYRKAALRHHPDKVLVRSDVGDGGTLWKEVGEKIHTDADKLFKVIGEAYAVLSDPSKRLEYDDREEMRNFYRDYDSGHPSTSYSSPNARGSWSGRQSGFSSSSERYNPRWHWYDSRSYSNSRSRW